MITLKQLSWSNAFSYGADNTISFVASPLTQLVGKNGHGKSSVALILEEVLFNKNSKGIKKSDIINRYSKDKNYTISLVFDRDGVEYTVETRRGTTQQVKLSRGGVDISAHTSTATYKAIEELIGMDHKTFAQIVYQSHAGSLEFLTSPDTARKKFLIELLNLGKYTAAGEVFKSASAEINKELAVAQAKVDTITQWISKYNVLDFTPKVLAQVLQVPESYTIEASKLSTDLLNIESTNKKIAQNNTYKSLQAKIKVLPLPPKPTEDVSGLKSEIRAINTEVIQLEKTVKDSDAFMVKMQKLHGNCPTCLQGIDTHKVSELVGEQAQIKQEAISRVSDLKSRSAVLESECAIFDNKCQAWEAAKKSQEDWEKYHQLINTELPHETLDAEELQAQLDALELKIAGIKREIVKAEKINAEATTHNSKLELIKSQLEDMETELESWSEKLHNLSKKFNTLATLVKTFSTTGLVAYKIENLVKDLEDLSNQYLGELSGGRFQIGFHVSGSDKLNVVVTDNGIDIDILALSGGERARVNVAVLLAIRRLMQSLSQSRINLLILDETIEALDVDGKEKLIEVLLSEDSLNTILVSHSFNHPLIEKVHILKEHNVSRIDT